MSAYLEMLKRMKQEKEIFFKNYREIALEIKNFLSKILGDVRVFVFGSTVKGTWNVFSDIDILVVSENSPKDPMERAKIKKSILSKYNYNAPLEIHFATPDEFEKWYNRMINVKIEI